MQKQLLTISIFLVWGSAFALDSNEMQQDQSPQVLLREQYQNLLQGAETPTSPGALAETFAKAVEERNGAVQFSLFCPALQKQYLSGYQAQNWVTGVSSPSIASYQITKVSATQYKIHYSLALQSSPAGDVYDQLDIAPITTSRDPAYCIYQYSRSSCDLGNPCIPMAPGLY